MLLFQGVTQFNKWLPKPSSNVCRQESEYKKEIWLNVAFIRWLVGKHLITSYLRLNEIHRQRN